MLQRAVAMVIGAVYEQDFSDCSYGFRPGRSAHQALQALWEGLMRRPGGWVLELDIEDFFGSLDHQRLREILRQRVQDGVLLGLIGKWLRAGVLEDGTLTYPDAGTPQGGVISPLLANVYLHEVLDAWFQVVVRPRLRGPARLVRFADDAVLVFAREDDAQRVANVLPKTVCEVTGSCSIRRRLVSYRLGFQDPRPALVRVAVPRSISWASRTTGAAPGPGTRSSSARRPQHG